MKKKGFTLIELLAVIVILAIIALIAVPIILNVIEKAKEGAARDSALAYMDAVELYAAQGQLKNNKTALKPNVQYKTAVSTVVDGVAVEPLNELISLKGDKPSSNEDYVLLDTKYRVTEGKIAISGYSVEIEKGKIKTIVKEEKIEVESIESLIGEETTIERGSETTINVSVKPENATKKDVIYISSKEEIVTVTEEGKIKGIKNGEAIITIKSVDNPKKETTVKVTVISPSAVESISLRSEKNEIAVGEYLQLEAVLEPSDATSNALTWESSNTDIAIVDVSGKVFGAKAGTVTIKGTTLSNKEATIEITIKAWTAVTGNGTQVGDEIAVGSEHFYVIKNDGTTLSALAKMNLNTTTVRQSTSANTVKLSNNSGWAKGIDINIKDYTGPVTTALYDETTGYEKYIQQAAPSATVRLITKTELKGLGCNFSKYTCSGAPAWVYSTSYWSGVSDDSAGHVVLVVISGGGIGRMGYSSTSRFGVRPVIEIPLSDI